MLLLYALNSCGPFFTPYFTKHEPQASGPSVPSRRMPLNWHFQPRLPRPGEQVLKRPDLPSFTFPAPVEDCSGDRNVQIKTSLWKGVPWF